MVEERAVPNIDNRIGYAESSESDPRPKKAQSSMGYQEFDRICSSTRLFAI